jgi:ABC-type lipoprotein release transport system permease subunit
VLSPDFENGADLLEVANNSLASDPAIADLGLVRVGHAVVQNAYLHVLGMTDIKGSIEPTVLSGRAPTGPAEVALGAGTMRTLGVSVGDPLEVTGADGRMIELTVVGQVIIPSLDTDALADEGALMTGDGADRLATTQSSFDLLINWTPGVATQEAQTRLDEQFGEVVTDKPPSDVANLRRVTAIPRVLAVLLGSLALIAIGHSLVVTVRRRRHDLAVLKVLGFRPRQVVAAVAWQTTLLTGGGLVVGVPLGIAVGTWSWSVVTSAMGLVNDASVPPGVIAAIAPTIVVSANVTAFLPARSAARTNPTETLRAL